MSHDHDNHQTFICSNSSSGKAVVVDVVHY